MPYYRASFVHHDTNEEITLDFYCAGWLNKLNERQKDPWYAAAKLFSNVCGPKALFKSMTLGYLENICEACKNCEPAQRSHMRLGGCLYVPPEDTHYALIPYS